MKQEAHYACYMALTKIFFFKYAEPPNYRVISVESLN